MNGKVVWITGASSGIGLALAKAYSQKGAYLIVSARRLELLEELQSQLSEPKDCLVLPFDLQHHEQAAQWVEQALHFKGRIDVLVNNGGIGHLGSVDEMEFEIERKVMDVNFWAAVALTKAVLPHMKSANYGRIISASSINAFQGAFGQTNYSASKAAIVGFTHSLCREVGKYNITVNAVAPGFIKSEMTDSMPEEIIKAGIAQIPVGRIGTPEDMAHAYLFLASKEAGFVSGHTLHANGGAMPN